MHFEYLATEIIANVFLHCSAVSDVVALSASCKRFRTIFNSSNRLRILETAAEAQYGPLEDAIQLITHNASQPAHVMRSVPFTLALLKQIVHTGRIAEKWCNIYPLKKWKHNFESRRLLRSDERHRFRRAVYRLWLYCRAFHNRTYTREQRMTPLNIQSRAELLHNWTTNELAEIADVHAIIRDVVKTNVCPSNGTIARKFRKRFADTEHGLHQLLFNIHLNYPPPPNPFAPPCPPASEYHSPPPTTSALVSQYYTSTTVANTRHQRWTLNHGHDPGVEGWGDDIHHYYVVEDMLKLDPEQILWLKENAPLRTQVENYTKALGEWFENNGETWGQTFEWVMRDRGDDVGELMDAVNREEVGVAWAEE